MTADELIRFGSLWLAPALAMTTVAISLVTSRRWLRTLALMQETLEVQDDLLDAMEMAQDPGREVHDRLARAIEARLVITDGPRLEPGHRRAAAQAIAAQLIDDIRRANLELEAKET